MFKFILISLFFLLVSCQNASKKEAPIAQDYFPNMKGCFLLYNMKTNTMEKVMGEENCKEQMTAFSSFKVPLAVIAFDSKILSDENKVLKWDGKKDDREAVNRDHDAKTWMSDSVVWFSQRITAKLGKNRLQKYLNDFEYGNKDLRGGLTQAWIVNPGEKTPALKISPYEQVEFMKKLWTDTLPASKRSMRLAREITFLETSPKGFKLNGKTGSHYYDKEKKVMAGWFISHLELGEKEYIAVTNFSDLSPTNETGYGGPRAKGITKKILADMELW